MTVYTPEKDLRTETIITKVQKTVRSKVVDK